MSKGIKCTEGLHGTGCILHVMDREGLQAIKYATFSPEAAANHRFVGGSYPTKSKSKQSR